ncbi:MAG: hypothetical protein JWQ76_804 [Ramlibacter sp.]|nr:hypothetical protein [Ramlibacter sp.]
MRSYRLLLTIAVAAAVAGLCFSLSTAADRPARGRPDDVVAQHAPGRTAMRVTDAHGVDVLATQDDAAPPMDVRLPAGHYRVIGHYGSLPRSETVEVISAPEQQLATR